jgi:phage-related protein
MEANWRIEYYKDRGGREVVKQFIDNLPLVPRTKTYAVLDLLMEYGINIGLPHSRKIVGTKLWELRILGESSIRIFYIAMANKTFWLLHGFVKRSQKTPENELKVAIKRLKELD